MINASAAFFDALHKKARFERIRGTIGTVSFSDANIISMNYSNRCSDTADVSFGSAYIGQLEATFVNVNIPRGSWRNKVITLEWGLVLEDESVEFIPVGVFTVTEANHSSYGVTIKASDNIAKLNRSCATSTTSGTVYDFLNLTARECGLVLGQTAEEIELLPNATENLGLYPNNDIKTWRDFISWIAQTVGGFVYAGRDGKIYLKSFADLEVVDSLTDTEREYSSSFSDYSTSYEGVSIVNIGDQTTSYYLNGGFGTTINLGSNPFLQYGSYDVKTRQRQALADVAGFIKYTPFDSSILSSLAYDLGDLITCSGGYAGAVTLTCCVMAINWNSKQLTELSGFGGDPSLASGKSKTDKELSGLMKKTSENEVAFYTFENAEELFLGDEELVDVVSIRFATISPKVVNLWHEIDLEVTADPLGDGVVTCQAFYFLDGELIAYSPVTTWNNDGWHLLHLLYFLQALEGGQSYRWQVKLKISGGTATIDVGDLHASLYGQGLVASDEWSGYIELADEVSITSERDSVVDFADQVTPVFVDDIVTKTVSDSLVALTSERENAISIADAQPVINLVRAHRKRKVSSGALRKTSDDKIRIENG